MKLRPQSATDMRRSPHSPFKGHAGRETAVTSVHQPVQFSSYVLHSPSLRQPFLPVRSLPLHGKVLLTTEADEAVDSKGGRRYGTACGYDDLWPAKLGVEGLCQKSLGNREGRCRWFKKARSNSGIAFLRHLFHPFGSRYGACLKMKTMGCR